MARKNRTAEEISLHKRRVFLSVLSETGRPGLAAREAGFADTSYLRKLRYEDDEFDAAWDAAMDAAGDMLEDEAVRRAREGVLEPEFYKGEVAGFKVKYSDQLLMMLLKGARPKKYAERRQTDVNVSGKIGVAVLPMTAPSIENWEQSAVAMHAGQSTIDLDKMDYVEVSSDEGTRMERT